MEAFLEVINTTAAFIGGFTCVFGCLFRLWVFVGKIGNGQKALLRDRIIQMYNYHIEKGYMRIHDHDNLIAMYQAYKAIGGNGTVARLVEELKALPHSPQEGGGPYVDKA